jgi:DNA repair exonuclease SbcCD ATPase subunit
MNNLTDKIREKIEILEKEIAEDTAKMGDLETALADAYLDGDPSAAHKALSSHREKLADKIGALKSLDGKLFDTSNKERAEIGATIQKEADQKRKKAEAEIKTALSAVEKILPGIVGTAAAGTLRTVEEILFSVVDGPVDAYIAEQRAERLPESFEAAPVRDEAGRCTWESRSGGHYFDFRFHRLSPSDAHLAPKGPFRNSPNLDDDE